MLPLFWFLLTAPTALPPSTASTSQGDDPALLALARDLESGLRAGEPSALDEHIDREHLLQRATRDLPASKAFIEELTGDARESGLRLGEQLVGSENPGRQVRLLRVQVREGAPRALFRFLSPSGGLNYFEFELGRNARGEPVIVDVYPYMVGELYSESLRRVYLMGAVEAGQCTGEEPEGSRRGLLGNMSRLRRIQHLSEAGEHQEAAEEFSRLPPEVLADKSFQIMRLNTLSHVSEEAYQEAFEAFAKAFPGEPALLLRSLDDSRLSGNPVAMMRAIDRLDRKVKDPYLNYLRGLVKSQQGDDAGARRFFRAALRAEPTLLEPYMDLLRLAIEEGNHAEAIRVLEALERDAGANVLNVSVEGSQGAESFLSSPEYKAWLERRLGRKRRSGHTLDL